ncbi:MAG: sel1 repeat family protein [Alphaproteobacteria bacterium]|nr:sel1 repeat family protein [Alphaproteobacteria bacterium]
MGARPRQPCRRPDGAGPDRNRCVRATLSRPGQTAGDPAAVIARCRPLAEKGDARAMEIVAALYDSHGTPQFDEKEAAQWYQRAAEKGSKSAQWHTARHYLTGSGVAKSEREAIRWFETAADQGNIDSRRELGRIYRDGIGMPKDLVRAYMWFNLAALQREEATFDRDRLRPLMRPEQILEAEDLGMKRLIQFAL